MDHQILRSEEDRSINVVHPTEDGGAIETRFVQRTDDTVIIYLSSASGCDRACRFCHLTQTGQTMMTHVDVEGYLNQAAELLAKVSFEGKLAGVKIVHFNFMARGDAMLNPHFIHETKRVIDGLVGIASFFHFLPKFKISTIFPESNYFKIDDDEDINELDDWVRQTIALHPEIEFYYSLYSLDPEFRKRWIPKAIHPDKVGYAFRHTVGRLRLHHALIKDVNTSVSNMVSIGQWLDDFEIHGRFNIVRYNPFSEKCGEEASMETIHYWQQTMERLSNVMGSYIISKVGMDVKASCGMFVS
jgi:adenine C2-methylase RlmN of 23S rRNA A2503 and tRNA A37